MFSKLRMLKIAVNVRIHSLLVFLMIRICKCFTLQNKIIAVCFSGKKYGDNPQFIVEKLHQLHPEYKYMWMKNSAFDYEIPKWLTPVIHSPTLKTLFHLTTSKVLISSHDYPNWMKKRKGQIFVQTWHGGLGIKCIKMDTKKYHTEIRFKNELNLLNDLSDVFISQSNHLTDIYRKSFGYLGPIFKCGYPKNDCLFVENKSAKKIIRENFSLNLNEKIFLYAPTFRDYFWGGNIATDLYNVEFEKVHESLEKKFGGNWTIMVHWHPSFRNILKDKILIPSFVVNATDYPDMQELLKGCDIVMSDYSSCIFDAALLDIPCFTFATDFETYKADRGVYYEMEELPFPYARNNEELIKNIEDYDHDEYLKRWHAFKIRTGLYEPGNASEVIAKKIVDFIQTGRVEWS